MLYQAIKTQCEKGPIDAITGEAYYTLDYDRLFDKDVAFKEVVSPRILFCFIRSAWENFTFLIRMLAEQFWRHFGVLLTVLDGLKIEI